MKNFKRIIAMTDLSLMLVGGASSAALLPQHRVPLA